jgi:MFS family permease
MVVDPYLRRGWRSLAMSLLSRLPESSIGVLLVLSVREIGHSYAAAGACSGAAAFGMAVGTPILGRAVDRIGAARVVAASGLTVSLAALAFALLPHRAELVVGLMISAVIGLAQPPIAPSARAVWRRILATAAFERVARLDATLSELSFIVGPLIFISLATLVGPQEALLIVGAALGVIAVAFAALPEVRALKPVRRPSGGSFLGALASPGVRTLMSVSFLLGMLVGSIELGVVQASADFGHPGLTGALLGIWGCGSITVGVLAMRSQRITDSVHTLRNALLVAAVLNLPLILVDSPVTLALALVIAGMPNAIIIGQIYSQLPRFVPEHQLTEVFSLDLGSAISGVGVGTMVAGLAITVAGSGASFFLGLIAISAAALVVVACRRTLRPIAAPPNAP